MHNYCTTAELAELRGCSDRYIRQLIQNGSIQAVPSAFAGNNNKEYLIPMSALSEHEQWLYQNRMRSINGEPKLPEPKTVKSQKAFDDFSESERKDIARWIKILDKWQHIRSNAGSAKKADIDSFYCQTVKAEYPDISISTGILYRKYKAYNNGDFSGLIDCRGGGNKGKKAMPDILRDAFLWFFLDERRLPISRCYALTQEWVLEFYPELLSDMPCERTFRRIADELPEAVVTYCRFGEKALKDKYIPYIERLYEDIEANDVWIADNHTFDFITVGENGKQHRLYLTAFTDAKSGVMVGWNLTDNPSSQSTLLALRHAIIRFGVPKSVYFDNGSEFLVNDIGGRGHRRKKDWNNKELAPTILQSLSIEMHNALVRNAMQTEQIQELKDKNMLLEDLNSSLIISVTNGEKEKEQLPSKATNTLRYMDYNKIKDKSTPQYWLQQECETGVTTGIRLYTDCNEEVYYCAALGKAYGQTIGDAWHVTLQNGENFNIILGECKGNDAGYFGHDDENYDGIKCVNVVEFVVDEAKIPFEAADKGTFTALDSFGGLYGDGGNIKSMKYLGRVWEPEGGTS